MPTVASHLQTLYGRKNWHVLWQTFMLVRNWDKVAGSKIASRSEPAYVQKNTLWIHVRDSVWMQHLHTMKPELIEKVQQFMPDLKINDIRWVIQSAEPQAEAIQADNSTKHHPDPVKKKAFEQISSVVENEECRKALCKLWCTYHNNQ